uniref:Uncharacterized protein n=1 Tax=Anguilla anguilla TaxID=7936 RepID=A0A0E9S0A8_ANGAN
MIIISYYNKPK